MSDEPQAQIVVAPTIWEKLSAVSRACSYVQKDGTNQFHRYNYATAAIIFEKVNLALFDNGLVSRTEWPHRETVERQTTAGKREIVETLQVKLIVTDVVSGGQIEQYAYGCGSDASDKAVMKAQTAALKYAWMMLLNISTGDDPEGDATTDSRAEGKPKPKAEPRGPYKGTAEAGNVVRGASHDTPAPVPEYPGQFDQDRPAILPASGLTTEEHLAEARKKREEAVEQYAVKAGESIGLQVAAPYMRPEKVAAEVARQMGATEEAIEPVEAKLAKISADAAKKFGRPKSVPDFCPKCNIAISRFDSSDGSHYWECTERHRERYVLKEQEVAEEEIKAILKGHFLHWSGK